jgi:hypothetical protein
MTTERETTEVGRMAAEIERQSQTPAERVRAFWGPFVSPKTRYENEPDDGHIHRFHLISPRSVGSFGPTANACVRCGWIKSWGNPSAA